MPHRIISNFSQTRLSVYQKHTKDQAGTWGDALKLFDWDNEICDLLWGHLRISELVIRNALAQALEQRYLTNTKKWWEENGFERKFSKYWQKQLKNTRDKLRADNNLSEGTIIANLMFGFWVESMNTGNFLFPNKTKLLETFPHFSSHNNTENDVADIYEQLKKLRKFRNRIAHHHPMIDKNQMITDNLNNLYAIIDYINPEITRRYHRGQNVLDLLNNKPNI